MQYSDFQGEKLPLLGFGTMRLPQKEDKSIDEEQLAVMIDYALKNGVNYFDTAYPYHGGQSETAVGKALSRYPRESYFLATKYPGHQVADSYDPSEVFEDQLKKCGVEYFDFYLLHNVCEDSINVYTDERWGIIDYFAEQKRLGRIKHLGFSSHGRLENLRYFLDYCGDRMEFCQIQLNSIDWVLQEAKEKYELLAERNVPVWVMEPVRGGKLAKLGADEEKLKLFRPDESVASWAFRWLFGLENVKMILSGMSDYSQMEDNVRTFSDGKPLSEEEKALYEEITQKLADSLPCTGCRYCTDGCPRKLDIPMLISLYNDAKFGGGTTVPMMLDSLAEDKLPSACIGCGKCSRICPQKIDIPETMKKLTELRKELPDWKKISRERNEAAKKMRQ